jgi:hypothetical protein
LEWNGIPPGNVAADNGDVVRPLYAMEGCAHTDKSWSLITTFILP